MKLEHLIGYAVLMLPLGAGVFALWGRRILRTLPWVKNLEEVKTQWGAVCLDTPSIANLSHKHQSGSFKPTRLLDFCALPASQVLVPAEVDAVAHKFNGFARTRIGRVVGAVSYPDTRIEEISNELRVYAGIFLGLFVLQVASLVPNETFRVLESSASAGLHGVVASIGERPFSFIAWKEAAIIAIFITRLFGERSVFLDNLKSE